MNEFKFCPHCAAPLIERVIGQGMERQSRSVCSVDCGFIHYDNPTPVVAVVVEYHGDIVLAHNVAWERPFYGLITGFLERAEAPDECAVREVKEELNLDATPPTLIGAYPFERMNQVIIGYQVQAEGEITLNEELDDFKLVPPDQCIVWPAGTGYALRDWLRTRGIEPTMMALPAKRD